MRQYLPERDLVLELAHSFLGCHNDTGRNICDVSLFPYRITRRNCLAIRLTVARFNVAHGPDWMRSVRSWFWVMSLSNVEYAFDEAPKQIMSMYTGQERKAGPKLTQG